MANFIALTPPLGQQPWGLPTYPSQPAVIPNYHGLPLSYGVNLHEFDYPPLSAPMRVLILMQYPGTIFPDIDQEDVFPAPARDHRHIQEIWDKYTGKLPDLTTYENIPVNQRLGLFIEREIAEWCAEYQELHHPAILFIPDRSIMVDSLQKSKKRSRREAFQNDVAIENADSRAAKQIKRKSSSTAIASNKPSMKDFYDKVYPADVVVDQDSHAYIMALNYLKSYAKSSEKYAGTVTKIIATQGMDPIAQRCAKFFAWGLKQAIHSVKAELTPKVVEPAISTAVTTPALDPDSEDEDLENSDYDELDLEGDSDDEEDEEIINFQPLNKKPVFKFEKSSLADRLGSFVGELKVANQKLEGQEARLEVSDSDEEHVEMNLGLGVLEEVKNEKEVLIKKA